MRGDERFFSYPVFNRFGKVVFGTSASLMGNARDEANLRRILKLKNIGFESAVRVQQVHGKEIVTAERSRMSHVIPQADGLIANQKGICLVIFTADCLPVFFISDDASVTGLLHCGWKSLSEGIISESLRKKLVVEKLEPNRLTVVFGPAIGKCCYKVDAGFWKNFAGRIQGETFDLAGYARGQLIDLGVKNKNIHSIDICTSCRSDIAFSYRRSRTRDRMASFIYNGEDYA